MRTSVAPGLLFAIGLWGCAGTQPEVAQEQSVIVCKNEAPLGTRFKRRMCEDRRIGESPQAREATRQMMYGNGTDTVSTPGN